MTDESIDRVELFKTRAAEVSARVIEVADIEAVAAHLTALVDGLTSPVVALPERDDTLWDVLESRLARGGAQVFRQGLRSHGGFDLGVTWGAWGIAATGTVVMDARDEDVRIASTLSETHVILLDRQTLRPDLRSLLPSLRPLLATSPNYVAFITGPSRTADIESVLALGAHGPRAVDILLMDTERGDIKASESL